MKARVYTMRTLLTGATGLIGANLVRTLLRAGERPRVLLTPGSNARSLAGLEVERVSGDVRDAHSLAKAMAGIGRVFHAAGHVRFDDAGRLLLWTINVEGTRQVLQAARSAGVRRLVHVSSSVAIGHGTLERPATEEGPPPESSTPYAESKRAAEELALGYWGGLEILGCNLTFVVVAYGTGEQRGGGAAGGVGRGEGLSARRRELRQRRRRRRRSRARDAHRASADPLHPRRREPHPP